MLIYSISTPPQTIFFRFYIKKIMSMLEILAISIPICFLLYVLYQWIIFKEEE